MSAPKTKPKRESSTGDTPAGLSEPAVKYAAGPRKRKRIRFGDISVPAADLTDEQIAKSIADSTGALRRAASRIVKPGVRIRPRKGVPLYHLDDDDPDVIIRTLDGVVERGIFAEGQFKKTP